MSQPKDSLKKKQKKTLMNAKNANTRDKKTYLIFKLLLDHYSLGALRSRCL